MKSWLWLRLAFREIRNNLRFSLFFILNLALGLTGFIALDSFKSSLDTHLSNNSKAILSADLVLVSNYPFEEKVLHELERILPEEAKAVRQISFFTMVAGSSQSRLVQLVAVDDGFPFYGKMRLQGLGRSGPNEVRNGLLGKQRVWVFPELLIMLGLQDGGTMQIGERSFKISDVVLEDPGNAFSNFGLAPRVYMGIDQVTETGLLSKKSRIRYQRLYHLPEGTRIESLVRDLRGRLRELQGDNPGIRVHTHRDASENMGRLLGYLNDYLGLVALIALFLASIGAAYLFRSFLGAHFKEMAILLSLGAHRGHTHQLVLWQLILLGGTAALISVVLALLILPVLPLVLQEFLPRGFVPRANPDGLWLALGLGTFGSIVFCLPVIQRIRSVKPLQLFNESLSLNSRHDRFSLVNLSAYVPVFVLYWLLSVWQAYSWLVGSVFIALLTGAMGLLGVIAYILLGAAGGLSRKAGPVAQLALRNLGRNRLGALSCFLAIAMGALLINLIPQIHAGLQEEIVSPEGFRVPSLFLIDVQPEQVKPMKEMFHDEGFNLDFLSPMIRSRLEEINGKPFETLGEERSFSREGNNQRRFRRRTMNLSYRDSMFDSEALVHGKPLAGRYDFESNSLPEISVEEHFADRLNLTIGDRMLFDIQGVPMEGEIVNKRHVKWNSFQPNFFILFQPGVLEDAPATYLGTVSGLDRQERISLQTMLVRRFPNVSVVDVTLFVQRVLDISNQMSLAIRLMAYLCILAGLVVVYSIARHEMQTRVWEINLLKVLGARFSDIGRMVQFEYGLLGLFAALFGVLLSLLMSYVIALWFFENLWTFTWKTGLLSILSIPLLSMFVAMMASRSTLRQKPLALLRAT